MRALLPVMVLGLGFSLGCLAFDRGETIVGVDIAAESGGVGESGLEESDPPAPEPCPAYSGIHGPSYASQWRTHADWEAESGYTGTSSWALTDWEEAEDGVHFSLVMTGTFDVPGYDRYESRQTLRYRCDADAMWILEHRLDYEYVVQGQTSTGWSLTTYQEPLPFLRSGLEVGMRWSGEVPATFSSSSGATEETTASYDYVVAGEETVQVAAGSFRTLRLTNAAETWSIWLAEDEGQVRNLSLELVDWTR